MIDYLCIGAAKAGTMSIIKALNIHPDIFCKEGETHFFDEEKLTPSTIQRYESSFNSKKKLVGEKSPSYCYLQYAIDRIYSYNPSIKLILLLREPVSRAFSHYNMLDGGRREGAINTDNLVQLKDITRRDDHYVERGYYDEIIEYIVSKFHKDNLYIGIAEEIKANPRVEYNKIYNFLGVKDIKITSDLNIHQGTYKNTISRDLELKLYKIYKSHNEKLYELLGRKIDVWENYYNSIL